jgi:hypothetical protein
MDDNLCLQIERLNKNMYLLHVSQAAFLHILADSRKLGMTGDVRPADMRPNGRPEA